MIAFLIRYHFKLTKFYIINDEKVSILTSSLTLKRIFKQFKDLCFNSRKIR